MVRIVEETLIKIKEEIRKRKNLNQKKVARRIGVSASEFSKILNKDRPFKLSQFIKIAEVLGMKPEDLLPGTDKIDVEKMSMIDLIKIICRKEIEGYLKEHKA